jgi:hypothetical protein
MGKIWEHSECVVLYWNSSQSVIGVKVEKNRDLLNILDVAVSSGDSDSLTVALPEVMNAVVTSETHLLLAGGDIPGSIIFDINLPKMSLHDTRQAIVYELPRHIPCEAHDIIFGYRILPVNADDTAGNKQIVRVLAVMKKQWNELISELSSSGIRVDAVVTPFLVVDPLLEDEKDILFYDPQHYVSFLSGSDFPGRHIILHDSEDGDEEGEDVDEDTFKENIKNLNYDWDKLPEVVKEAPSEFFPPLLIAAYGMTQEYTLDKNSMIKLPNSLLPERYRTLRFSFFGLTGTIILLILLLIGRFWWESKDRYHKLKREIKSIQRQLVLAQRKQNNLLENSEVIKEIIEREKGIPEVATCLQKLSAILPKSMSLIHFSSRDDSIEISIRCSKPGQVVPDLKATGIMKEVASSARTNSRDKSTITTKRLTYIPPEKRNGKK